MEPTVPTAASLNQAAVTVAVGGLVLALTQSTKRWSPEGWGPLIAAAWTTLAMLVWMVSQPDWPPQRTAWFDLLAVWVAVYTSALGLYSAAMVPSNSQQMIGTGSGATSNAGNVPVGETAPKTRRQAAATTTRSARKSRPSRAKPAAPAAVLTEPVVQAPVRRPRPRPAVTDEGVD